MIHRIFSTLHSFKELKLHPGLNILLSDKTPDATEQQTRNRTGKSSLIELIHFICGGNCDQDSTFRAAELVQSSFGLEMDVYAEAVRVSRSASDASKIVVEVGEASRWRNQPKKEKDSERRVISNIKWREVLGSAFFGIDLDEDGDEGAARPTFRALFSYFARLFKYKALIALGGHLIDLLPVGLGASQVHQDGAFLTRDISTEKPRIGFRQECANRQFVDVVGPRFFCLRGSRYARNALLAQVA
jgi:hypothetical protein